MSSFMPWVARALTIALFATMSTVLVGISAASAADWVPAPPVIRDICGTSQDGLMQGSTPDTAYSWNGTYLSNEAWTPSGGVSSGTVVASYMVATNPQPADVSFAVTFGAESDASCVEAADTVTTRIVECNTVNTGTKVEFTYTNTDDSTDRAHTRPVVEANRWDDGQYAYVIITEGIVADGQSASFIGGDGAGDGQGYEFFLSPGTYNLTLTTKENGKRKLPNTLYVPACGGREPPKGDPHGGTTTPAPTALPKGTLKQVTTTKMRVTAINKGVTRTTAFKVVANPTRGKTTTKMFQVAKGKTVVRTYKAPARTRFVLKARVLVKDASGRMVAKWKVLKRSTLKAR